MRPSCIRIILLVLALTTWIANHGHASSSGDINRDGTVDHKDVIMGLRIMSGATPAIPSISGGTDVNQDGKIGMAEVLYALRPVPLGWQASIVGPLSGAVVTVNHAVTGELLEFGRDTSGTSNLQVAGCFALNLPPGVADNEWVVVSVTGGTDLDADGNGILDPAPAANQGTLHALAQAGDWRTKRLRITPLTELAWRYVQHLITEVPPEDVAIRLQDLARNLIKTDIDGNGSIGWSDILAFNPANPAHRACLATDYAWLSAQDDKGHSILGSLLAGQESLMLARMDAVYSYLMTRFPVPDSRYHSVKLALAVFGPGRAVASAPHTLAVDSTTAEPVYEDHLYAPQSESAAVTLTATPAAGARILSWSGCDAVSANLSQCTVPLNRSQSVVVNFGRITTQLAGTVHDLSRTFNIVGFPDAQGNSTVTLSIPADMTDMIAEMAAATVGDFVVGPNGGGFLRRITAIGKLSDTNYKLDTVEASLDEVIVQGTGQLFKQMENGDLDGYVPPPVEGGEATVSAKAFTGLAGVTLQPSANSKDRTFKLVLGTPTTTEAMAKASQTYTGEVVVYENAAGDTLSATGEINVDIALDFGMDYKPIRELDYFKWIVHFDLEQRVELSASASLASFDLAKVKIGTFRFAPIVFAIGAVPVWVSPILDLFFFADGSVEGALTFGVKSSQQYEGGLLYNKNTGWSVHKDFSSDHSFIPSSTVVSASLKGGVEMLPVLKIYDATGPAIPQQIYAKMEASYSLERGSLCSDIVLRNLIGFETAFLWDLSGSTKLGQLLHLDQLEEHTRFNIFNGEYLLHSETLYDNCPEYQQGSHLLVKGDGIVKTIDQGYAGNLATTLTMANTGDQPLNWNTSFVPAEVLVTPSFGTIAPGGEQVVEMSLATAGLPAGRYQKKVFFFNQASVGQNLEDDRFGNTWKTIDVKVLGTISDTPAITGATSTNVGKASLNWTFAPAGSTPFIGFQIFATTTPENVQSYRLVRTVGIHERTATIAGLTPGTTYSFDLRAFSNSSAPGPFSNKVSLAIAGTAPAVAAQKLNDTGITWGGDYPSGNNATCTSNIGAPQDCHHGRDATHNDPSDGHAGFSYTKLDGNGNSLPASAANWSCVRDNVTGLVWEGKTDDGTIHDKDNTYRWGGKTALGSGYGTYYSDWNSLVNGSNNEKLCGFSDWRVPTRQELIGLNHYGRVTPAIDTAFFPNTPASAFWSASPYGNDSYYAWYVHFNGGGANYQSSGGRGYYGHVRLVRSGQ